MPQWIPALLGGVGLYEQSRANNGFDAQAQQQFALQQQLIKQQQAERQQYLEQVGQLAQQGAFNPAARLAELGQQGKYDMANAMSSEAGAAKSLGYRAGDTAPIDQMNATRGNFQLGLANERNTILNQDNANYLAALQGAPRVDYGSSINALGENGRFDVSREQGLGGMLGALSPYLTSGLSAGRSSLAASSPATYQGGGYFQGSPTGTPTGPAYVYDTPFSQSSASGTAQAPGGGANANLFGPAPGGTSAAPQQMPPDPGPGSLHDTNKPGRAFGGYGQRPRFSMQNAVFNG